jgi:hypothetical protein
MSFAGVKPRKPRAGLRGNAHGVGCPWDSSPEPCVEQEEQEELSPLSHRTPPPHLGDAYANAVERVRSFASAGAAAPHPDDVASGAASKWMMMTTGCDDTYTAAAGGAPLLDAGEHMVEEASATALARGGTFLDDD